MISTADLARERLNSLLEIRDVDVALADAEVASASQTIVWSKIAHHPGDAPLDIRIPITRGIAGYVAMTGETVNIADAHADSRFDPTTDRETATARRRYCACPSATGGSASLP